MLNVPPLPWLETTSTIGPLSTTRQVRDWALVLSSMDIPHAVRDAHPGWVIVVAAADLPRAVEAIRLYEAENKNWPPERPRELLPHARSLTAPLLMGMLLAFFAVTGAASGTSPWFARGTADSGRILHGELWRAVTALTLHADVVHVVGNVLCGTIFLSAVNRRLGDGLGPFLVVLAGSAGNLMNAAWHGGGHLSIGASTAVFSAVGILAATQFSLDQKKGPRRWYEHLAPLVGGLAILGMLGASPQSDLLAHLFGLIAGLCAGVVVHFTNGRSPQSSAAVQLIFGALTIVLVAFAWVLAFRARMA